MITIALLVQLTASALTMIASWFYGNKSLLGPWLGLASQVPWWTIMFQGGLWGLLPVNITLLAIHTRNIIKWRKDATSQRRRHVRNFGIPRRSSNA